MQLEEMDILTAEEWVEKLGIVDEGYIVSKADLIADDTDERRD